MWVERERERPNHVYNVIEPEAEADETLETEGNPKMCPYMNANVNLIQF